MTTTQTTPAAAKKAPPPTAASTTGAAKPKRATPAKKAAPRTRKAAAARPAATAKSTFTAAKPKAAPKVAGVTTDAPAAPKPLVGEPFGQGTVYDAQEWLEHHLGLTAKGALQLFHHETKVWDGAVPGEKTWVSTKFSRGVFGTGFYTATKPDTGYGQKEFQLSLPVKAFKGKKVFEMGYTSFREPMPDDTFIIVVPTPYGRADSDVSWFIFKPGDDAWINKSATTADWDADGEPLGWS